MESKNKIMLFVILCFALFICLSINMNSNDSIKNSSYEEIDNNIKEENKIDLSEQPTTKADNKKGNSDKTTDLKNKKFFTKEYSNNSLETFRKAEEYAKSSSQKYLIIPFSNKQTNRNEGYEVIFEN